MIFKSIAIHNFLSVDTIEINLQNRGLVMIEGKNYDNPSLNNNGAGKSSVIEAIVYALFGRTLRGLRGDNVINRTAGKDMRVCLELIDEGSVYKIIRQRKCTNTAKYLLFRDNVNITPKSETDFDQYIIQLIRADYQIFTASLLFSSESFKLSSASDSDIKKAFDTILGLDTLMKAYNNVKIKLKVANNDRLSYESQIDKLKDRIQIADKNISELKSEQEQFIQNKAKKEAELQTGIKNYTIELDSLEDKLDDIFELQQTKSDELKLLYERLDAVDQQLEDIIDQKNEVNKLNQSIHEFELRLAELRSDVAVRQNKLKLMYAQQDKLSVECKQLRQKIQTAYSQIGQPCETCGRPLTITAIESAVTEYQTKLDALKAELDSLDTEPLETGIQSINKQITEIKTTIQQLQDKKQNLETAIQNTQSAKDKLNLESDIKEHEKSLLQLKYDAKTTKLTINQTIQKINDTQKQLDELQAAENPADKALQKLINDKSIIQNDLDEITDKIFQLKIYISRLKFWETGFSNQGIKSFILDDVTPYLNTQLNKYLNQLTSGKIEAQFSTQTQLKSGEQREKFSLCINNTDGGDQYQANSAGERKRIDLAINLAIQDLLSSRAYKPLDIALFDEVFDTLDENGIDSVINLLYELTEEKSTILVISHNEYLKSYFTNIITIAKKGGLSNVQQNA